MTNLRNVEMEMLLPSESRCQWHWMSMAMDSLGVPAVSLNAFQVAMHTTSAHSSARLKKIEAARIRRELDNRRIVVVTGFQGIDKYNDYTTLGRGGSDTTAVALAAALHADACEIYTDVEVYTPQIRVWFQTQKIERNQRTMRCLNWQHLERKFFTTVLLNLRKNMVCSWLYVQV